VSENAPEPHPRATPRVEAPLAEADFEPGFVELVRAARAGAGAPPASARVVVHAPHVWQVPVLRPERCAALLARIDARRAEASRAGALAPPPNSMHEHGAGLFDLGFGALLDDLLGRWVAPLGVRWFEAVGGSGLDDHHGYLVEYGRDADEELGFHVDDSELTLNLCLGERFTGAELVMLGLRCDEHRQTPVQSGETVEIEHAVGSAVLHAGRHRHRVEPIRSGRRRNLIVWCRSSTRRARNAAFACGPWCGAIPT